MSATHGEGRPLARTATTHTTSTRDQFIAVTDNRRNRCVDCDCETLARGYHRCRSCLLDLRDALRRRREAEARLARWSA
jgi:hypothetical protein